MSLVLGKRIDENGFVEIQRLKQSYPKICVDGVDLLVFVNRVFNDRCKPIKVIKKSIAAPIREIEGYTVDVIKLDLSTIALKYGIPNGYYVELVVTNFAIKSDDKTRLIPVFPNEIISDCDYHIKEVIEADIKLLEKIAETYEIIGKLYHMNLTEIAEDLREAEIRLEKGDIDGSIKFFRKTVEGLRNFISQNKSVFGSDTRADVLKNYLTKSFQLLSNFGEHAGTEALMAEALLSKSITVSIAKYIVEKLEE